MLSADINAAFDCSILGMGYINPKARTGVFRAVEQTLLALLEQPKLNLHLVSFNNELSSWSSLGTKLYLQEHQIRSKQSELVLGSSWEEVYLKYPVLMQKYVLENLQLFEILRKAIVAMQIPFDKVANLSQRHLPKIENWQIYHSPYFPLPENIKAANIPRILTIYDLAPILYPTLCSKRTVQQFNRIIASIDIHRDWIVCISEATKRDFCEYTGMSSDRVFVASLAASTRFQPIPPSDAARQVLNHYNIADAPYLLSLATLEPRKNLKFLIRCFSKLILENPSIDLQLVLVGISGWKNKGIFQEAKTRPELAERIVFTGFLPDQDLSTIYSGALAFAYPSLYEGFGLPPLEAMRCGVPVITSNVSSLPEVVGDAGIMIDPTDEEAMCQAILNLVNSNTLRQSLAQRGLARAEQFSWARCAEETSKVYQVSISSQDRS
ncbi:glycosyltransferase family 1 protein [Pseudanabaena sp. FACHB-2040]|uniref:glycosyltransferase family 4 protein n=1 Tax=Pseudanabaena sp. FACHB-2040 TaxID=2692859 RepID=UPI0016826C60|nr:glycosyltransferase family 1 protein [Pseudanabaena sp. FACHB-2040]MBD2260794.1 glycosyltransferase family 4 protein [Pseudanabaena sp. FACHB-2040]